MDGHKSAGKEGGCWSPLKYHTQDTFYLQNVLDYTENKNVHRIQHNTKSIGLVLTIHFKERYKKKLAPSSILREAKIAYYARNMCEAGRFFFNASLSSNACFSRYRLLYSAFFARLMSAWWSDVILTFRFLVPLQPGCNVLLFVVSPICVSRSCIVQVERIVRYITRWFKFC